MLVHFFYTLMISAPPTGSLTSIGLYRKGFRAPIHRVRPQECVTQARSEGKYRTAPKRVSDQEQKFEREIDQTLSIWEVILCEEVI